MCDLYIERQADRYLYDRLRHGEYSYILSPPQTGKTNLLYRVKSRLEAQGIKCAAIYLKTDLKKNIYIQTYSTGSRTTDSDTLDNPFIKPTREYYWQCISELATQFDLLNRQRYKNFRQENERGNTKLPNKKLLPYFIDNILLKEISQNEKIVIFVDEIDELLDLYFFPKEFAGDFLQTISYCYEHRENEHPDRKHTRSKFNRLTFALFGETSPREIVKDYNLNFYDAQRIKLESFRFDDLSKETVSNLVQKISGINQLSEKFDNWEIVIREILKLTNGQPLLTNKLLTFILEPDCNFISKNSEKDRIARLLPQVISSGNIINHRDKIVPRLLAKPELLQLYQGILQKPDINITRRRELIEELISLGLIIRTTNGVAVHNRIYKEHIFDWNWIQKNKYISYFLIKNRTYFSMSSSSQQPPEPQKNQNSRANPQQSTNPDWSGAFSNAGNFFIAVSQIVSFLVGTYYIFTFGLSILAVSCYLIAVVFLIPPVKNLFSEIINRIIPFITRHWKLLLLGLILFLIINYYWQISAIKKAANYAKNSLDKEYQIEALENAIKIGNDLNKINWIKYVPFLRNQLPSSPVIALQEILSKINEENRLFASNGQLITAVSINSQGDMIATGTNGGTLQFWYMSEDSIKEKSVITNQGKIYSLSFSYDGQKIATGGGYGSIKIWNSATREEISNLPQQRDAGEIRSISFSRDGNYLIAGGSNGEAYLWNLQNLHLNNKPRKLNVSQQVAYIYSVSFSPNNQIVATAGGNGSVRLWNLEGKLIGEIPQNDVPFDVCFNQSGTKIAVAFKNGSVEIWDLEKIQNREEYELIKRSKFSNYDRESGLVLDNNPFYSLKFDDFNKLIVIVEDRNNLQYLEYLQGKEKPVRKVELNGYDSSSEKVVKSASFNDKINKLITAGNEKIARLWNLDLEKTPRKYFETEQNSIKSIAVRSDPNTQAKKQAEIATLDDKTVELRSRDGGTPISLIPAAQLEKHGKITNIRFTPDEEQLATAGKDGVIRFWNLKGQKNDELNTKQGEITSISFSPDGKYVAVADTTGTIKRWQYSNFPSKGKKIAINQGNIYFMGFSPDGQSLVTLGNNTPLPLLWDLSKLQESTSIKPIRLNPTIRGRISGISFSPDGFIAIATDKSQYLQFFTSPDGKQSEPFDVKQPGVVGISFSKIKPNLFSPNQPRLVTAGTDGTIKVWNWLKKENEPITEFKSDLEKITSISLSPDGKYIIVGGDDGRIENWSVQNLEELLEVGCNWLKDYHASPNNSKSAAAKLCSNKTRKQA